MSMIIGISGKKESGKSTIANFINDHYSFCKIKLYSFADPLKNLCIELFGLTYQQCYGTDEQKNSLTYLRWENVPSCIPADKLNEVLHPYEKIGDTTKTIANHLGITICKTGYMTAREVLQYVGTNIFRRMHNNIWVQATINKIQKENSDILPIVIDCRFPNEVKGIKNEGGYIIRLTRNPHKDNHFSETALDRYNDFDLIIKNDKLSIEETNLEVKKYVDTLLYNKYKYLPRNL
jgi:hypothetical protein